MFTDLNIDRPISSPGTLVNLATKSGRNNMQAKTDPQHGQSQVEIPAAVPCTLQCRPAPENDPPALFGHPGRRGGIRDHRYVNVKIAE
jgi:hypothetical protein